MAFGERLQELRRARGMTQEDFAAQLKVSRQAVSKWESCRGYPELEKIIYICNRYGATMNDLFCEEVPLGGQETPGGAGADGVPDTENGAGRFCEQPVPGQQMGRSGGAGGSDRPGGPVYAVFERRRRQRNDGIVDCGHRGLWRGGGGDRRAGLHLVRARAPWRV